MIKHKLSIESAAKELEAGAEEVHFSVMWQPRRTYKAVHKKSPPRNGELVLAKRKGKIVLGEFEKMAEDDYVVGICYSVDF